MKRFFMFMIVFILMFSLASLAFAGVVGTVKGFFGSSAVNGAVAAVFLVLSGIFGVGLLRFKKPVIMIYNVYREYSSAKLVDSVGGEQISKDEWDKIFLAMGEAVMALLAVAPGGWSKKLKTR